MIVLGVLLVVIGIAAAVAAVIGGGSPVLISWHQYQVHTRLVMVFLAGAATLLVVELGLLVLRDGSYRQFSRWRELQRLRRLERDQARTVRDQDRSGADEAGVAPR